MNEIKSQIEPHKVTKPIQLLACWLVGLILVNGSFLTSAVMIKQPDWIINVLVVASVINVPIFLICIFLLQTRFRPEMQEDQFYSQYIDKKFGNSKREVTPDAIESIRKVTSNNYDTLIQMIEELEKNQNEISTQLNKFNKEENLDFMFNGELLKSKIINVVKPEKPKIFFENKTVSLNAKLNIFNELARAFKANRIPVHEIFGREEPLNFLISFGDGFSTEEIITILNSVQSISDGYIAYAHDEYELDQYKNKVLIGSYGEGNDLTITQFLSIVSNKTLEVDVYRLLGK
ncbi:hypothetical protein [Serpentinicella alkaliphila]|uniref:hypothetical protein n=1 Tax=Serpentinicella alkaliphila TaxID=1734049 RepID=UPI00105187F7|nr:hypothetical protein [Serpentinicella alkaliphila]QUH25556.1 hypothetical protein HZR23_07265 [Serpentinicella alkaliphila]